MKSLTSVVKLTGKATMRVAIIIAWASTIHMRRRPQRSDASTEIAAAKQAHGVLEPLAMHVQRG